MSKKKSGQEIIHSGETSDLRLIDYWKWAHSDILSNSERGVFAEFLVASALGITDEARVEWEPYDLNYKGLKIEVKASGYLQAWEQTGFSKILFGIARKRAWDKESKKYAKEQLRHADLFVFSLHECKDRIAVNPLDVRQWAFYFLEKSRVEEVFQHQKSVPLEKVMRANAIRTDYRGIKDMVDSILEKIK